MKNIKNTFYLLMAFFFSVHFVFPGLVFLFFGFIPTYQKILYDQNSLMKGVFLNFFSLIVGAALIYVTKSKSIEDKKKYDYRSKFYLIVCLIFSFGALLTIGQFENNLKSLNVPSGFTAFMVFGNMFLNIDFYFLFGLTFASDFIPATQLLYVLRNLLAASRSASLSLFLFVVYSLWRPNVYKFLKRYTVYFVIAAILSYFSFNWATSIRSQLFSKNASFSNMFLQSFINNKGMREKIIARFSFMEAAMLPIMHKDQNLPNVKHFYKNYSIANQLKLIVNNLVPGDVFPSNVMPNQYYRSAFLKMPENIAKEYYTSINMTLPVYFYMYFGFTLAIVITGVSIWIYYLGTSLVIKIHPLLGTIPIYYFYSYFLSYFDFVALTKMIVLGLTAIPLFIIISKTEEHTMNFIIKKPAASAEF